MSARAIIMVITIVMICGAGRAEEKAPGRLKHDPATVAKWRKQFLDWRAEFFATEGSDEERFARQEAGREMFAPVDDPAAVPAIAALLRTDKLPQYRRA